MKKLLLFALVFSLCVGLFSAGDFLWKSRQLGGTTTMNLSSLGNLTLYGNLTLNSIIYATSPILQLFATDIKLNGYVYLPEIAEETGSYVLYYDDTTGNVTYGALPSSKAAEGPWLYNDSSKIYFNETKFNESTYWVGDGENVTLRDSTDNVGIGTDAPKEKLHVVGNAYVAGDINATGNITAGSGSLIIDGTSHEIVATGTTNNITLKTNGAERLKIRADGQTEVKGDLNATQSIYVGSSSQSKIYVDASGSLVFEY